MNYFLLNSAIMMAFTGCVLDKNATNSEEMAAQAKKECAAVLQRTAPQTPYKIPEFSKNIMGDIVNYIDKATPAMFDKQLAMFYI